MADAATPPDIDGEVGRFASTVRKGHCDVCAVPLQACVLSHVVNVQCVVCCTVLRVAKSRVTEDGLTATDAALEFNEARQEQGRRAGTGFNLQGRW